MTKQRQSKPVPRTPIRRRPVLSAVAHGAKAGERRPKASKAKPETPESQPTPRREPKTVERFDWHGITVAVSYEADWMGMSERHSQFATAHLEIEAVEPRRQALPVTETRLSLALRSKRHCGTGGRPSGLCARMARSRGQGPSMEAAAGGVPATKPLLRSWHPFAALMIDRRAVYRSRAREMGKFGEVHQSRAAFGFKPGGLSAFLLHRPGESAKPLK
jgi:hypothetical protein